MSRVRDFVKQELTLCIAFLAALVSCFFVPPDGAYWSYLDFRTLALLYCLMVVVAGLRHAGVFTVLAHRLCAKAGSVRRLGLMLVLLCFFSAMLITNDVALLTFVPFAVVVLGMAHQEKELIWVVVLQTVAANLGSVLTPVGNPQNLYLYSRYGLSMGDFLSATLPLWLLSLLAVLLLSLRLPRARVEVFLGEAPCLDKKGLGLYLALFPKLVMGPIVPYHELELHWRSARSTRRTCRTAASASPSGWQKRRCWPTRWRGWSRGSGAILLR